jgi:hypothetical protein
MHVIGVYTGTASGATCTSLGGQVTVRVNRREPMVLVISAYEEVRWVVEVHPEAMLKKVVMMGHFCQTAILPPGVVGIGAVEGTYGFGNDCDGGDTPRLVSEAEALTDLSLRSFHGCYSASSITFVE